VEQFAQRLPGRLAGPEGGGQVADDATGGAELVASPMRAGASVSGIVNSLCCLIPDRALAAAGGVGTGTLFVLGLSVGLERGLAVRLRPRLALAVAGAASLALLRGADPNAQLGVATDVAGKGRARNAKRRGDLPEPGSSASRPTRRERWRKPQSPLLTSSHTASGRFAELRPGSRASVVRSRSPPARAS
jgi:hypothetical protein